MGYNALMPMYSSQSEIPDQAIKEAWGQSDFISFSARRFNNPTTRSIGLDGLGWWINASRVFQVVNITPQDLRPAFSPQLRHDRLMFPLDLLARMVGKGAYVTRVVELPRRIERYDQLGSMPLSEEAFGKLAVVINKGIRIMREDGASGDHYDFATLDRTGRVVVTE